MVKKAKQLSLIEEVKPPVSMSVVKSALQKAYRRNHPELMEWAFEWAWQLDPKWLVWRTPIFPAEEAWRGLLQTGRLVRKLDTMMGGKNPSVHEKAKMMLKEHLFIEMAMKKNKDGDGLRTLACVAVAAHSDRALKKLMDAVANKVSPEAFQSFEKMIEVQRFVGEKRFVEGKVWAEIWERVDELRTFEDRPEGVYMELRDTVGAAYFRGKKGGMVDDKAMLVACAYLAMDDYQYGTYGGRFYHEPSEIGLTDSFHAEPQAIPPLYNFDMHTGEGKRMLAYLQKVFPYRKNVIGALWFFMQSGLVNETETESVWWNLAIRATLLSRGMKMDEVDEVWAEIRDKMQPKLAQWIMTETETDNLVIGP